MDYLLCDFNAVTRIRETLALHTTPIALTVSLTAPTGQDLCGPMYFPRDSPFPHISLFRYVH